MFYKLWAVGAYAEDQSDQVPDLLFRWASVSYPQFGTTVFVSGIADNSDYAKFDGCSQDIDHTKQSQHIQHIQHNHHGQHSQQSKHSQQC